MSVQTIDSGAFKDCNWTGVGFRSGRNLWNVNVQISAHPGVPGMPSGGLFHHANKTNMMNSFGRADRSGWMMYDKCLATKYNVSNVPLKPVVDKNDSARRALFDQLSRNADGLGDFHPDEIQQHNVGSNRGLMTILFHWLDNRQASDDKYMLLVCDCNIFMRIIKVTVRHVNMAII